MNVVRCSRGEATQLLKRFEEAKKVIQDLGDWDTESSHLQLLKSTWAGHGDGSTGFTGGGGFEQVDFVALKWEMMGVYYGDFGDLCRLGFSDDVMIVMGWYGDY